MTSEVANTDLNSNADLKTEASPLRPAETIIGPVIYDAERDYHGRALRTYPGWLSYLTALVTVCIGVYSSLAFKWQLKTDASPCKGCPEEPFTGSLLQAQLMFLGEALALLVWYIDDAESRKVRRAPMFEFITVKQELLRKPVRWYWWPIAALHDVIATVCINTALMYAYASTVGMLRNFMVVACAIMQMVVIKKALLVYEWIGVILITVAMVLTAVPAFMEKEDSTHTNGQIVLGVVLAIAGTAIQSSQLLFEEWILRRGRYPALKAVGIEGVAGFVFTLIAWGPFQKLVENVNHSWYQQFHSGKLGMITGIYIPGALIFNGAGLATTKLAGGLLRGICFACRAPLVWLVSLAIKWQTYDHYNLASMLVFIVASAFYINQVPWMKKQSWMVKPVHFCCTDPKLDGVLPGHEKEQEEQETTGELAGEEP